MKNIFKIIIISNLLFVSNIFAQQNINVPTIIKFYSWGGNAWNPFTKDELIYSNNKLISQTTSNNNGTEIYNRIEFIYNSNGQILEKRYLNFQNGVFEIYQKQIYDINNNNLLERYTIENFDQTTQSFIPNLKSVEKKDPFGRLIFNSKELYSNNTWVINNLSTLKIVYFQNGPFFLSKIDSNYSNNILIPRSKEVRSYNTSNKIISIKSYSYDSGNEILNGTDSIIYSTITGDVNKIIYSDNLNNPIFTRDSIELSNENETNLEIVPQKQMLKWIDIYPGTNNYKERYSVTSIDNFGSRQTLVEVYNNNRYTPSEKKTLKYDFNKNIIENIKEKYNTSSSSWYISSGNKSEFIYDVNNNIISNINKKYNTSSNSFINENKYEYSDYININLGNLNTKLSHIRISPNPIGEATSDLNLNINKTDYYKVKIVDLLGNVVYSNDHFFEVGMNAINLDFLNIGLYSILIKSDLESSCTKLIVKR